MLQFLIFATMDDDDDDDDGDNDDEEDDYDLCMTG